MGPHQIPKEAVMPVHMGDAVTGESPYWDHRSGRLWWIDIQGQRLLSFAPATGARDDYRMPQMIGMVAGMSDGELVIGLEDGLYAFTAGGGVGERILAVEAADPRTRINDGKADVHGRLWFGTMDKTGSGEPIGALYRRDLDGMLHCERKGVRVPNAIAFSPDGRVMYFTDSKSRVLERIAYDPELGRLGKSQPFATFEGDEAPDGVCVDADGGVWVAVVGGARIERRQPNGVVDTIVNLPVSRPTMPMLGGADGRSLLVTSQRRFLNAEQLKREPLAGQLLMVRVHQVAHQASLVRSERSESH